MGLSRYNPRIAGKSLFVSHLRDRYILEGEGKMLMTPGGGAKQRTIQERKLNLSKKLGPYENKLCEGHLPYQV